jgi:hypothetical protein
LRSRDRRDLSPIRFNVWFVEVVLRATC